LWMLNRLLAPRVQLTFLIAYYLRKKATTPAVTNNLAEDRTNSVADDTTPLDWQGRGQHVLTWDQGRVITLLGLLENGLTVARPRIQARQDQSNVAPFASACRR
jgi:hypothetical protein